MLYSWENSTAESQPTQLDHISPRTYHQLLNYHWRCCVVATSVATNLRWTQSTSRSQSLDDWYPVTRSVLPTCSKCSTGGSYRETQYCGGYLERAKDALKDRPCGATVLRSDLVDGALKDANCRECSGSAIDKMRVFTAAFAQEIDKVTSAVSHCGRLWIFSDVDSNNM
jgi:hypothetical protein